MGGGEGGSSIIQGRQPQEVSAAATRSASPALLFSPNLTASSHMLLTYLLNHKLAGKPNRCQDIYFLIIRMISQARNISTTWSVPAEPSAYLFLLPS